MASAPAAEARRLRWVVGALIAVGVVVTTLGNFTRVPSTDPQFNRDVAERTVKYGGTLYENGIVNKGPLEPMVHLVAARMSSSDGYWFVMSGFVALLSLFVAWIAYRTARWAGADPPLAAALGVGAFVHYTYSGSYYAGSLHVRNLTIALLGGAWILIISDRAWTTRRKRIGATIGVFALLGLGVQTLLTTVFVAGALGVATFALLRHRAGGAERLGLAGHAFIATDAVLVAAPLWYALRGAFDEFWTGWFVHARIMGTGLGRGFAAQVDAAWDAFFAYHQGNPVVFGVVAAFWIVLLSNWRNWMRPRRIVFGSVAAWWLAAWLEIGVGQRFGLHYDLVLTMPTLLMASLMIGATYRLVVADRPHLAARTWWPAAAALVTIFLAGPSHFGNALGQTLGFRGTHDAVAALDRNKPAKLQTARAVLDLATVDGDALLAWTNDAWAYQEVKRVSATRFIWKSLLIGEVYQGQVSPRHVLPYAWEWFAADVAESKPVAAAEFSSTIAPETPFATYISSGFTKVYSGAEINIYFRRDIADLLFTSPDPVPWSPTVVAGGWTAADGLASHADATGDRSALELTRTCTVVQGRIQWPEGESAVLSLIFKDPAADRGAAEIMLDAAEVTTWSDFAAYEPKPLLGEPSNSREFLLLTGRRSAALVIGGEVVAAALLPPDVAVTVLPRTSSIELTGLTVGSAPAAAGCPAPG